MNEKKKGKQIPNEKDKHTYANTNVCLNYKCTFFVLLTMHVRSIYATYMEMDMDMVQYGYSCSFSAYLGYSNVRARKLHFKLLCTFSLFDGA